MAQSNTTVGNGVKLVGEMAFLPGTSHLLDGEIKTGALYAAAGFAVRILLGAPAVMLVAADSFSRSVTGKGLIDQVTGQGSRTPEENSPEQREGEN